MFKLIMKNALNVKPNKCFPYAAVIPMIMPQEVSETLSETLFPPPVMKPR